jgi:hypothetical protein
VEVAFPLLAIDLSQEVGDLLQFVGRGAAGAGHAVLYVGPPAQVLGGKAGLEGSCSVLVHQLRL